MSLKNKKVKKQRNVSGKKGTNFIKWKKALKNTPRLYLYHRILKQYPKTVKIEQKNDFEPLDQPLVKKKHKRYTFWRMDELSTLTMISSRRTYSSQEELVVAKPRLFKTQLKKTIWTNNRGLLGLKNRTIKRVRRKYSGQF